MILCQDPICSLNHYQLRLFTLGVVIAADDNSYIYNFKKILLIFW